MKSNPRSPSRTDQRAPEAPRKSSRFGRAFSDVWSSLGGRSEEQAAEEALARREAELQVARAREILQQDRAGSTTRRGSHPEVAGQPAGQPEETATRPSAATAPFTLEIASWIADAIADLPDASAPIAVTAEPVHDGATTSDMAPATLRLGFATTEMAVPLPSEPVCKEPIRTLTMARLLAKQGYRERALSIYEWLLAAAPNDATLSAEADLLRADISAGEAAT